MKKKFVVEDDYCPIEFVSNLSIAAVKRGIRYSNVKIHCPEALHHMAAWLSTFKGPLYDCTFHVCIDGKPIKYTAHHTVTRHIEKMVDYWTESIAIGTTIKMDEKMYFMHTFLEDEMLRSTIKTARIYPLLFIQAGCNSLRDAHYGRMFYSEINVRKSERRIFIVSAVRPKYGKFWIALNEPQEIAYEKVPTKKKLCHFQKHHALSADYIYRNQITIDFELSLTYSNGGREELQEVIEFGVLNPPRKNHLAWICQKITGVEYTCSRSVKPVKPKLKDKWSDEDDEDDASYVE